MHVPPLSGADLTRGTSRHLRGLGMAVLCEFVPTRGLRVDVIALGPRCEVWIVECKSCRADFTSDRKWGRYLEWCDRYFWAVAADFPNELLPPGTGVIRADAYGAELVRSCVHRPLAPARRRSILERFARTASERLAQSEERDYLRRVERVRS